MILDDLRKLTKCSRAECSTRHQIRVTLADLVEVLKEEGAYVTTNLGGGEAGATYLVLKL